MATRRFEFLEARCLLAPLIEAGQHLLAPNTAQQSIAITLRDAPAILGVNLRAQLGDGDGPDLEPVFGGVDLSGTIWDGKKASVLGGPIPAAGSLLQSSIVLTTPQDSLQANGVLAWLLIDTVGVDEGQFELRLAETQIGADTDLVGDVAGVVNGSIALAAAGDANLDGRFDSNDLVLAVTAGEYEDALAGNSSWFEGDWNGDLDFTSQDLVAALQTGNYETASESARVDATFAEPTESAWSTPAKHRWTQQLASLVGSTLDVGELADPFGRLRSRKG